MKIFHVIPRIKHGGAESAVLSSIEKLNVNNEFRVISLEPPSITLPSNKYQHITSFDLSFVNPVLYLKFLSYIIKEQPDIIIFSLWKSSVCGILLKLMRPLIKTKTCVIIHSSRFAHAPDKFFSKLAIRFFDYVLCDSNATKKFIHDVSGKDSKIISFITKKNVMRERLFTSNVAASFVYIGRLNEVKNVDKAIRFISKMKLAGVLDVKFHIYGPDEGGLSEYLKLVDELLLNENIHFMGEVENKLVFDVLDKYNFYLQLSSAEGMGMSVIDAMQVGLVPCVTSVGEIASYADNDINSVVFNAHELDDNELLEKAKEVKSIIDNPKKFNKMSSSAYNLFRNNSTYSDNLEETINKILS